MTKESLADQLNGREYPFDLARAEEAQAKAAGLVVIFGASDDLCELRGAIHDELSAYKEAMVMITKDGKLLPEWERGEMEIIKKHGVLTAALRDRENATKVMAFWCKTPEYSWTYETKAPHAAFDIMEDGEKYCRGIVLDLREL